MATTYHITLTSAWMNYHPKDLHAIIEKALYNEDLNEITLEVTKKS